MSQDRCPPTFKVPVVNTNNSNTDPTRQRIDADPTRRQLTCAEPRDRDRRLRLGLRRSHSNFNFVFLNFFFSSFSSVSSSPHAEPVPCQPSDRGRSGVRSNKSVQHLVAVLGVYRDFDIFSFFSVRVGPSLSRMRSPPPRPLPHPSLCGRMSGICADNHRSFQLYTIRRVMCSTLCPCLSDADWCLQPAGVPDSRRQARPRA